MLLWLILQAAVSLNPPLPVLDKAESYTVAIFAPEHVPPGVPLAILGTIRNDATLLCDQLPWPTPFALIVLTTQPLALQWDDPDHPGRACQSPPLTIPTGTLPLCAAAPCPLYPIYMESLNAVGTQWSMAAVPLVTTTPASTIKPECIAPLGNRAVAVFPTGVQQTTGKPGSRARANYQLASPNSPIITVRWRIDGVVVADLSGDDLAESASIWFSQPPSGTHTTSVQAINAFGCAREVAGAALTVP